MVPLKHKLKSGDTIEILTSPSQRPNKDWLKIVKTSRAKNKIRQYIKVEEHERSKALGEVILEKELKRENLTLKALVKDGSLQKTAESFSQKTVDDLLSSIGYGKLSARKVMTRLIPKTDETPVSRPESGLQQIFQNASKKAKERQVVRVKGVEDVLVRFARCCSPVPGDPVVGFITRGRGISVHSAKCPKVFDSDPHRLIEIEWDLSKKAEHKVRIRVVCEDRPGLLADMSRAIRDHNVNITQAQIGTTKDKKAVCLFALEITDVAQLGKILSTLEGINGVISASRFQKKNA